MHRRLHRLGIAWFGAVLASCAAFSAGDADDPGAPASVPASANDASDASDLQTSAVDGVAPVDADMGSDATAPSLPSILPNGGFESDVTSGCGEPWDPQGGRSALARVNGGHTGSYACQACYTTGSNLTFRFEARLPAKAGVWKFAAWVHAAGTSPPASVSTYFGAFDAGGNVLAGEYSKSTVLGANWTLVDGTTTVSAQSTKVYLQFAATAATGACLDVDDVAITAPP